MCIEAYTKRGKPNSRLSYMERLKRIVVIATGALNKPSVASVREGVVSIGGVCKCLHLVQY